VPKTRSAVDAVLPPLVVSLIGAASRRARGRRVAAIFDGIDERILDRLDSELTDRGGAESFCKIGIEALTRLLGAQSALHFVSRAARYAQMESASVRYLLGILVPIVFAAAKRLMSLRGFDPAGLAKLQDGAWLLEQAPSGSTLTRPDTSGPSESEDSGAEAAAAVLHRLLASALPPTRSTVQRWVWFPLAGFWVVLLAYWALATGHNESRGLLDPPSPSRLSVTSVGSQVEYSGVVADERSRSAILSVLAGVFGDTNLIGDLRVDARLLPPRWLKSLELAVLAVRQPGLGLHFSGDWIDVDGGPLATDRERLIDTLRAVLGEGYRISLRDKQVPRTGPARLAQARTALAALGHQFALEDFATVLEAWVINFPADSDEIPQDQQPLIRGAARLMQSLPEGAVIEVRGHTDDAGDAQVNELLSRVRAESVREALIDAGAPPSKLRAEGYGSQRPVASNSRPEGRVLNRRIDFHVAHD
jgi:outer membrane protein OmpA-like peptidoglycan-associated protein